MDFTYLVESGTYKKSDLPEVSRAYIDGMEEALEVADDFLVQLCDEYAESEESETLTKIKSEMAHSIIRSFKNWLVRDTNEHIVAFAETQQSGQRPHG